MSFIEANLLEELSYGFSGGPTWDTRRISLRNGHVRRNANRTRPLHQFSGSFDLREDGVRATLIAMFNACRGGAYAFRFRNPMDYTATDEAVGIAAGGTETLQLMKTYEFGGESIVIPIRKPRADGFQLYADDVEIASTLDTITGEVEFTADQDAVITWTGVFDLPMFFQSDDFEGTVVKWQATTVDITLEEDLSA